jgi:hypothetical protein
VLWILDEGQVLDQGFCVDVDAGMELDGEPSRLEVLADPDLVGPLVIGRPVQPRSCRVIW